MPVFTNEDQNFVIGKAIKLQEGSDITIIATGHLVWESLEAAKMLFREGIKSEILNIHTIKPLDENAIISSAKKTNCVITAEEHNCLGGLGESVARLLSESYPTAMKIIGTKDTFGESGKPSELLEKYGLSSVAIYKEAKTLINKKNI